MDDMRRLRSLWGVLIPRILRRNDRLVLFIFLLWYFLSSNTEVKSCLRVIHLSPRSLHCRRRASMRDFIWRHAVISFYFIIQSLTEYKIYPRVCGDNMLIYAVYWKRVCDIDFFANDFFAYFIDAKTYVS